MSNALILRFYSLIEIYYTKAGVSQLSNQSSFLRKWEEQLKEN